MCLVLAVVVAPPTIHAGKARISKAYTSMTLAGDGWWEIESPVWIDDVLNADGFDVNLDTTLDPAGLNVFTIVDSSTYHLKADATTGIHGSSGFISASSFVAIGAEDYPTTSHRLSQTVSPRGFVLRAASGTSPTINLDGLVNGDPGVESFGSTFAGITFEHGKVGFTVLFDGLCFTNDDDYPTERGDVRPALIQQAAPDEDGAPLARFVNCVFDCKAAFFHASQLFFEPTGHHFAAGAEIEVEQCGFRYDRINSHPSRVYDPGSSSARNRSNYLQSYTFLGSKITGTYEFDHCTFIGVLQTDFPVGSGTPISPPLGVWSIFQGDDLNGPDWLVRNSILFNWNRYTANGLPPTVAERNIEWQFVPGAQSRVNIQIIDPLLVNTAAVDARRAFDIGPDSPAAMADPMDNIGYDTWTTGTPPPPPPPIDCDNDVPIDPDPPAPSDNAPNFSRPGGVFTSGCPFSLELSATTPTVAIRYTLDGSKPTATSTLYSGPILIDATTRVRAQMFIGGTAAGEVASHSYLALAPEVRNFSSNLPLVVIDSFGFNINAESQQLVEYPLRPIYSVWIDTATTGRAHIRDLPDYVGRGGMRTRGNISRTFPQKSYRLETWDEDDDDLDVGLLGMPAESDWILQAPNDLDPTLMHNHLPQGWFQQMGQYGVRTRFVEVIYNPDGGPISYGDYMGVYLMMENSKRGRNRINVEKLEPTDLSEPEITGGYLLKMDRLNSTETPIGWVVRDADLGVYNPRASEFAPRQRDWIIDYLQEFESVLYGGGFRDPVNGYAKYIDVDSFVDYDIIIQLTLGGDGYRHSMYMFKNRGDRLTMGPVWDFDATFTLLSDWGGEHRWWINENYWLPVFSAWWERLAEDPDYWQRWIDRWAAYRASFLSDAAVNDRIDEVVALLSEAQARHFAKWGGNHQAALAAMRAYLANRMSWIDAQFPAAPEFNQEGGVIAPGFGLTMDAPAGTIYYTLDGSDPRLSLVPQAPPPAPVTLVAVDAPKRVLAPAENIGTSWRISLALNDSSWLAGTGGVGYDRESGYESYIETDVGAMFGQNGSCYIRILFNVGPGQLDDLASLNLRIRYDDGFEAYLNGAKIANDRAPVSPWSSTPPWNSVATEPRDDAAAVTPRNFYTTANIGSLREGANLLAIQGMNSAVDDSDLLISAELVAGAAADATNIGVSPNAVEYTGDPVTLAGSVRVMARALVGGEWSAPTVGVFRLAQPGPGDVIISEFLANANGNDDHKEWIELFNTTPGAIDINGWTLSDNDNDSYTIDNGGPLVVPAKGYVVLGETAAMGLNGGVALDYAWGLDRYTLGNAGDEIILSDGATVIHAIGYENFKNVPTPVSDIGLNAEDGIGLGMWQDYCNGAVAIWRKQTSSYGTNGDTGTPGADNDGVNVCAGGQGSSSAAQDRWLLYP